MESHRSSNRRIAERGGTSRTDAVETTTSRTDAVETTAGTDLGTGIGANTENRMRIDKGLGAGRMT